MRRRIINRKLAVVTVLATLAVVGLVYAAWTTNGSGSGYTKAGTAQALSTIDVSASTSATLYPGTSGDVLIKVDNPNLYSVVVSGVSLNGTNARHIAGRIGTTRSVASTITPSVPSDPMNRSMRSISGAAK